MFRSLRVLWLGSLGAAILYCVGCGLLFFSQRSLIYFPQPASQDGPTITLPIAEARVLVSTRTFDGPRALIYFGGNAEDISRTMPSLEAAFPAHAIYALHYRGYGGSSGEPSEAALFADALTLFDTVKSQHPNVEMIGRSLGSGIAIYVASLRPIERVVLVTPFDSLLELAAAQYPFVPVSLILQDKFESGRYAPRITAPTLIVAAEQDEIVPRETTMRLHSHFQNGVAWIKIISGGHNTISNDPDYTLLLTGDTK